MEILVNLIQNARQALEEVDVPNKRVTVDMRVAESVLTIQVQDEGEGFDPDDVPDPTSAEFIERPSGRGLMLMRAYLNFVEYTNGGRRITMERERNSELPIIEDD